MADSSRRRRRRPRSPDPVEGQETLRLSAVGTAMFLGDLEHRVLDAAWRFGRPASARELFQHVVEHHEVVLITVLTVANRLVRKGLLDKRKRADVFHYAPTLTRDEFTTRASRYVVHRILGLGSDAVAASFVDVLAERDPAQLAELGRLVRAKLRSAPTDD